MQRLAIELTDEQVEAIVVEDLKYSLELQFSLNKDEGGQYLDIDQEIVDALKVVLRYYMIPKEAEEYLREVALQELTTQAQIDGQYR